MLGRKRLLMLSITMFTKVRWNRRIEGPAPGLGLK
jgi:hypothetical protein